MITAFICRYLLMYRIYFILIIFSIANCQNGKQNASISYQNFDMDSLKQQSLFIDSTNLNDLSKSIKADSFNTFFGLIPSDRNTLLNYYYFNKNGYLIKLDSLHKRIFKNKILNKTTEFSSGAIHNDTLELFDSQNNTFTRYLLFEKTDSIEKLARYDFFEPYSKSLIMLYPNFEGKSFQYQFPYLFCTYGKNEQPKPIIRDYIFRYNFSSLKSEIFSVLDEKSQNEFPYKHSACLSIGSNNTMVVVYENINKLIFFDRDSVRKITHFNFSKDDFFLTYNEKEYSDRKLAYVREYYVKDGENIKVFSYSNVIILFQKMPQNDMSDQYHYRLLFKKTNAPEMFSFNLPLGISEYYSFIQNDNICFFNLDYSKLYQINLKNVF